MVTAASRFLTSLVAALCFIALGQPQVAQAVDAPAPQQTSDAAADLQKSQIAWAEAWGRAVFDAYKATGKVSDLASDTSLSTAANAVTDKCDARYRAVIVAPPGMPADRMAVYYIGSVPKEQGLMVGRHYRIEVSADGKKALSVTPSSDVCFIVPPQTAGSEQVVPSVAHALTPTPSEFHVFLSLLTGQPLIVGTTPGLWQVKDGRIQLLKGF